MKRHVSGKRSGLMVLAALALAAGLVWSPAATASELEETLSQVGQDYAQAYLAPFSSSYGANINSGLYTTAYIGKSKIIQWYMKDHPVMLFLPATYEDATNKEVMSNIETSLFFVIRSSQHPE